MIGGIDGGIRSIPVNSQMLRKEDGSTVTPSHCPGVSIGSICELHGDRWAQLTVGG